MPYHQDYNDQVRFGIQEPDDDPRGYDLCDHCGGLDDGLYGDDEFLCNTCLRDLAEKEYEPDSPARPDDEYPF